MIFTSLRLVKDRTLMECVQSVNSLKC